MTAGTAKLTVTVGSIKVVRLYLVPASHVPQKLRQIIS